MIRGSYVSFLGETPAPVAQVPPVGPPVPAGMPGAIPPLATQRWHHGGGYGMERMGGGKCSAGCKILGIVGTAIFTIASAALVGYGFGRGWRAAKASA